MYALDADDLQYRVEVWNDPLHRPYRTVLATTQPQIARASVQGIALAYPGAHIVIRQRSRVLYDSERD